MVENELYPNFLETAQQDLQEILKHEELANEDLQYALDRSCTPHCVEAIAELHGVHIPSLDRIDEYVGFLKSHGAHPEKGSNNADIYGVDDGWYNIAIADLLRINGYTVVSQQLQYDSASSDSQLARVSGRVRSDEEVSKLDELAAYGGDKDPSWLYALSDTLHKNGYVIASIKIPSSKQPNAWGKHSIVLTGIEENRVHYFDPDKLALERYKETIAEQNILHEGGNKLMYSQGIREFLGRLTGEVIHIFPPI